MLVRTIVGIACIPLILAVVFLAPPWALAAAFSLICALAVLELFNATGMAGEKPVLAVCMLAAAAVPVWAHFGYNGTQALAALTVLTVFFTAYSMAKKGAFGFGRVAVALFAAVLLPLFISLVIDINNGENGIYLVLFPFASAWVSDTAAYFTGTLFGKHRLCPGISPKKSVEGAVGAVIVNAAAGALYAFVLRRFFSMDASYPVMVFAMAFGSVAGQFGDLIFSWIKREYEVKDYGKILPGHGGVLDRFDSLFLAAPVVYLLMKVLPFIR